MTPASPRRPTLRERAKDVWRLWLAVGAAAPAAGAVAWWLMGVAPWLLGFAGLVVAVTGALHGVRVRAHRNDPEHRRDRKLRRLTQREARLSRRWTTIGVVLAGAPVVVPGVLVAVAGLIVVVVSCFFAAGYSGRGVQLRRDGKVASTTEKIAAKPAVRHTVANARELRSFTPARWYVGFWGWLLPGSAPGAYVVVVLLAVSGAGFMYAGLALAYVGRAAVELVRGDATTAREGDASDDPGHREEGSLQTYAALCPSLPDPSLIGHGLGALFEHDGAVEAGCGTPAIRVNPGTWISTGLCHDAFRSLGVAAAGRAPVLIYGAPARFAFRVAEALRYAERLERAGGELVIVGTARGAYVFARSTPSMRRSRGRGGRCDEVTDVARPFVQVPPAMGVLWMAHVRRFGWSWPSVTRAGRTTVELRTSGGQVVARGACSTDDSCSLTFGTTTWHYTRPDGVTSLEVPATQRLATAG